LPLPKTTARVQRMAQFQKAARPTVSWRGMCEAQRLDYELARRRVITWQQYFQRWGR
jgi:hypothetical protein